MHKIQVKENVSIQICPAYNMFLSLKKFYKKVTPAKTESVLINV